MLSIKNYILWCLLLCSCLSLKSQTATNPFDLQYKETVTAPSLSTEDQPIDSLNSLASPITTKPPNPFDIIKEAPVVALPSIKSNIQENKPTSSKRSSNKLDFRFWVLLGLLIIFSSIFGISRNRLSQIYNSFLNENFLRQTHRYNEGSFSLVYLFLYLLAFASIAIFAFLGATHFNANLPNNFSFLLKIFGGITLLFIGKHLLLQIIGYIFPLKKELSLYSFTIMIFGILIGLLLFPLNAVIAYAPVDVGKIAVYLALGAILAIYLFRTIRGLSIGSKHLILHKFHFFVYLCTVEILPVVVLVKMISSYVDNF